MGIQILLAEHDQVEGGRLSSSLRDGGHDVQQVSHSSQTQPAILAAMPELLLMKWTWPERKLIDMLLTLYANMQTRGLPVIVSLRHGDARVKIAALDAGADDYVVKPCDTGEPHAHIRAVLRRRAPCQHGDDILQVNGLRLGPLTLGMTTQIETGPCVIMLNPLGFCLSYSLVAYPQRVYSRTQLLDRVWDNHVFVGECMAGVHVRKLYVALAGTSCDGLIRTVRGGDYRLVAGTGGTTTVHVAEAIGMQLEAATCKAGPPAYGRVPVMRLLGPA